MPRKQNTAAQRAREAQHATGAKYTIALREATAAGTSPTVFTLREVLAEYATAPAWTGEHPEVDAPRSQCARPVLLHPVRLSSAAAQQP